MQRNLAGLCFTVTAILFGLAVGTWWLQFAVFSPDDSVGRTEAILDDHEIRSEITTVVAAATSATLDQTPGEIAAFVDPLIASRAGAAVMTEIVRDGHERAIGARDEPVRITGEQMVRIVRDEVVADLPAVTLPIAEISTYRILANWSGRVALGLGVLGAIVGLFGIVTRPERAEWVRGLGEVLTSIGIGAVVIGILVPTFVLPAINDTTWSGVAPRLALRLLPVTAGVAVVLVGVGGYLVTRSVAGSRRKQWSTPLSVGRYREERRWS